jgi:hypothetical protein
LRRIDAATGVRIGAHLREGVNAEFHSDRPVRRLVFPLDRVT